LGQTASAALLDVARDRLPGTRLEHGDLEGLPFEDESFDVVTGLNSFQHAADPVAALQDARRVTTPGGKVFVMTWGEPGSMEATAFVAAAGLHNLAMTPCGNIAFHVEDGQSVLTMLDVGYMTTLSPHPALEEGVALARPAYAAMFTEVLGVEQGACRIARHAALRVRHEPHSGPCQGPVRHPGFSVPICPKYSQAAV
jgi:SAM-dependent methyltransferase